jgi:hypothetical protein
MTKSVYVTGADGAVIWLKRSNDKFKQEMNERIKNLWKDIKDEDLDEEE